MLSPTLLLAPNSPTLARLAFYKYKSGQLTINRAHLPRHRRVCYTLHFCSSSLPVWNLNYVPVSSENLNARPAVIKPLHQEPKMMSRWMIGAVLMGILFVAAANNDNSDEKIESEIDRSKRQYQRRPAVPEPVDEESVVHYDPSGLGFEIHKPGSFQYIHRPGYEQHEPAKPLASPPYSESKPDYHEPDYQVSYDKPRPPYPEPKPQYPDQYKPAYKPEPVYKPKPAYKPEPVYKPEPAYKPEPTYKPKRPYQPEPGYKPAEPAYPEDSYHHPHKPTDYETDYAYYCPKIGGYEAQCRLAKDCAVWYDLVLATPGATCQLADGYPGVCCPPIPYNSRSVPPPRQASKKEVKLYRDIDVYSLNAAAHAGRFQLRLMDETEKLLRANNITVRQSSSQYTHLLFFQTTSTSRNLSRGALAGVQTTRELGKRFELNAEQAGIGLSQYNLKDTILSDTCPANPVCDDKMIRSPFRTMDGSCNNIRRSFWGKSRSQFQRAILPVYSDGVWQPRRAQNGGELPSPRLVSISVVPDIDAPHETDTLWVMQYGQFLDHDLTSTPVFRMNANGQGIMCCSDDGQFVNDTELAHPECLPIEIPVDDPFFSKFKQRCMSFVRSTPAPRFDCSFGYGEQMNQLTHFLDHSNVYGSDNEEATALRTFKNGALKVTPQKGHHQLDLLPPDEQSEDNCTLSKSVSGVEPPHFVKCFKAGDARSNENPTLAVTHTVFLREHNRLVTELSYLNPYWDDERLYQEARRIMTAQMQHITYNEWLPVVLGRDKMQELGLLPLEYGFSQDYDDDVNPSILNEFATAAFRFGHTLIQGKSDLINHKRKKEAHILLRQHFFKSQVVYTPGNLDKFLIGMATQPIQDYDNYFTEEVTNHLFEEEGKGFGMDLVSLNLQRGREHGIPGYNSYRALCGLPRAGNFHDLLDQISPAIVERFELLYDSVDDVDLFIGAISERPVPGALVGPTFQCLVADQFMRLKRGDRFFYDLAGQAGSFTEEQLNEIRKTSFARLICDNSHVVTTQPLVFKSPSAINPIVDCDSHSIPRIDLHPWLEGHTEPYRKPYAAPYKKY